MTWLLLTLMLAQPDEGTASPRTHLELEAWIDKTDREMKRLPPNDFSGLPTDIQRDLAKRSCTIPQTGSNPNPHNVISGYFQKPDRLDWAALCSVDRTSRILIYPGGRIEELFELPDSAGPDRYWIQGGLGFSRAIASADATHILRHYKSYGGPTPPPIDHEGLEEIYDGKASTIHYWHDGSWLALQGAD